MSGIGRGTVNFSSSDIGYMFRDTERKTDGKKSRYTLYNDEYLVKIHGRVEKIYPDSSRTFVFYQSSKPEEWCDCRNGICESCHPQKNTKKQKKNIITTPQSILTLLPLQEGYQISTEHGKQLAGRSRPPWEISAYPGRKAQAAGKWMGYTMNHSYNDEPAITFLGKNGDVLVKMWYNKGVATREGLGPQTIKYDSKGRIKEVIWRKKNGNVNPNPSKKVVDTWRKSNEAKGTMTVYRRRMVAKEINKLKIKKTCKTELEKTCLGNFNKRAFGKTLRDIFEYL